MKANTVIRVLKEACDYGIISQLAYCILVEEVKDASNSVPINCNTKEFRFSKMDLLTAYYDDRGLIV